MTEKKINICGKEVGLAYCMATEQGFEELTGKSIREIDADKQGDLLALAYAAVVAYAYKHTEAIHVSFDTIMYEAKPAELTALLLAVVELRAAWYEIPLTKEEGKEKDGDAPKN